MIIASCRLFLTGHGEIADALHITYYTCQVINIMAMAFRTFMKVVLAYVSAAIAYGVWNVECEIIAPFLCSYAEQLAVLCLGKMFFKIEMKSRTACKMLYVFASVKAHLVNDIKRLVLDYIEIAVVTVAWHSISVFPIPFCMLYTNVFRWNHFAVE